MVQIANCVADTKAVSFRFGYEEGKTFPKAGLPTPCMFYVEGLVTALVVQMSGLSICWVVKITAFSPGVWFGCPFL